MSLTVLTQDVQDVVLSYMEGLDSSKSLGVAILLRNAEWDQLTQLETDPSQHLSAESYIRNAAATDLLRKLEGFPLDIDLESTAIEKWMWAEKECFRTNVRLNEIEDFGTLAGAPLDPVLVDFIHEVRKNIYEIVGSRPPELLDGAFGPGATISDKSGYTTVCHKMSSTPTFTTSALYHLIPWTGTKWAQAFAADSNEVPINVRGNYFFTVPKTSRTKRSCAKEPSINGFYQLGLGRALRHRLFRRGIDLDNGQDVHRRVACSASKTGDFATIDLTSASDCISTSLVRLLMPHGWHSVLSDLRSSHTCVKGAWHRLEKFSSMGNGFTFELETLIFLGICMACMRGTALPGKNLHVFGDDIIIPTKFARDAISALKFFGLTPNMRKTFMDGNFRESCGGDFFNGVAVRPFFLKEVPNEPQQIISFANGIRRMALQSHDFRLFRAGVLSSWFKLLDVLPSSIRRCRGPEDLGDIVIHDEESRWDIRWRRNGIRYVRCYRPASWKGVPFVRFSWRVQHAAALYGVVLRQVGKVNKGFSDPRSLLGRDSVLGYKVGWTPYS